jgi:class 3 adenylate cyclase
MDPSGDGGGGLTCGSCGAQSTPMAKYCGECGARLTEVTQSAEYKQVTVLFADVVRSMNIAATVGAERLREIMAELVNITTAVVKRYGGMVDKFTGDGIMAVFGAPVALEDHAVRACLAASEMQDEVAPFAAEVGDHDGVELALRIGLNSGQVIAGEVGSASLGYTTIGEQVGIAQRMESVAPPGGVMLSATTARLVDGAAALGEPELVQIKGAHEPVSARRLLRMRRDQTAGRADSNLVGRRWEMSAVEGVLARAIDGLGAVVGVVGPPGIGKSRLARELSATASARGVEVFTTFCESHTSEVPFHAVARLLRVATGVEGLGTQVARDGLRDRVPDADPEDLLLLADLLGIGDPDAALPQIDPDARRRRLTALVNAISLARESPVVYIVEDVHWIDSVSESMLVDFFTVIPQTPSLVIVTYRPEYRGALARVRGAQTMALAPLSDDETAALINELLGPDPSIARLSQMIAERAAGTPFFAEEIVCELAERGALRGEPGAYVSTADVAEISVPATLQATISARIDRLDPKAKRALGAAAVVGSPFGLDLLTGLGIEPVVDDLVAAQLVDQVKFTRLPEYVFHHPLIRMVAYESQLKSDRAELHRRVAAAIEERQGASVDEDAALIAQHLEAAGDFRAAFDWHMRAAAWLTNRDIKAARRSWERARIIADSLRDDDADRTTMRIVARTLLCGSAWRVHENISGTRFDELRELCTTTGDKASLAMGMAGLVAEHTMHARVHEAAQLASEYMALLESIGDPTLIVGLSCAAIAAKCENAEPVDMLRWSQTVIDMADGDPAKGNFIFGSPLAIALAWRGLARWWLGRPGWREDFEHAVSMARSTDPMTHAMIIGYKYTPAIPLGLLVADDAALRDIDEARQIAERIGDDVALASAQLTMGLALVHRDPPVRQRGLQLLAQVRDIAIRDQFILREVPIIDVYAARESAARGDIDSAVQQLRTLLNSLFDERQTWCIPATGILVEVLLARGGDGDLVEAEAAVDRLAATPTDDVWAARDIMVLRLRAMLAWARGDEAAYRDFNDRYRAMATSLGFEGHRKWAEAMP